MVTVACFGQSQRTFRFQYEAAVTGLSRDQTARVWVPLATSTDEQTVQIVRTDAPAETQSNDDRTTGNRYLYFESKADQSGSLPVSLTYTVTRKETSADDRPLADPAPYLQPDRLVPVGGRPAELIRHLNLPNDPTAKAHLLYDLVDDRMQYRKDQPGWGRGDATWACDSRFGNCTDFHSLFMSLARSCNIPTRFEIGFSVPTGPAADVAGYHCWAFFADPTHGWTPVDISEANKHPEKRGYFFGHLDADRFTVSHGRDLTLVPPQDGPPVNFIVYPYAEVDGQPWPDAKMTHHFRYEPVEP